METIQLHPWASTPEATEAARKAVRIPMITIPSLAIQVGEEELFSRALVILAECAMPPRDQPPTKCAQCHGSLENVRKGSYFCSRECRKDYAIGVQRFRNGRMPWATAAPQVSRAHIGTMHSWPETERQRYAVKIIGYALNNWLRMGCKLA